MENISGAWMAVKIGGMSPVLVPGAQSWEVDDESEELDGTTAEDGGYDNPDSGVEKLTVNATFVVDTVDGDFTGLANGTLLSNLKLYTNISDTTPVYVLPVAKVFRATYGGEIKGRVTYRTVIKSKGTFTRNLG